VAPEVIAQVRKQKLLFAELAGVTPSPATKSSKPAADRPRSERRHGFPVG
jgi:hypothetical protein